MRYLRRMSCRHRSFFFALFCAAALLSVWTAHSPPESTFFAASAPGIIQETEVQPALLPPQALLAENRILPQAEEENQTCASLKSPASPSRFLPVLRVACPPAPFICIHLPSWRGLVPFRLPPPLFS